ncbi:MAG: hypothetical protein LBV43_05455 [Prevotella sp.]|jgi:hypothetical protein|nr:hypothetical protein [Prevotella sp.]
MSCRLIQNIKHTCEYNPGGITELFLLPVDDFITYYFRNDSRRETCDIDRVFIKKDKDYIQLDVVSQSNFTESYDNGIYKQQLTTFVHTLQHSKTADALIAEKGKYITFFRTGQGRVYTFGSDGGASFTFTQITGQTGEASGYNITLSKNSIYPLFEVDAYKFNKDLVLSTENRIVLPTEDMRYAILI